MQGVDAANIQVRPNLIYTEGGGPSLRILPEQGKLLNLREGQIINSSITLRPEGNVIQIAGKNVLLPRSFGNPGDGIAIKVSAAGGAFLVTRIVRESMRQPTIKIEQSNPLRKRFSRILNLSNFHFTRQVFSEDFLNSLRKTGAVSEPLRKLDTNLVPITRITAKFLKSTMEKTGLFTESAVKKAQLQNELNLKTLLAEIRGVLKGLGRDVAILNGAIDELEAYQLESLAGTLSRQPTLSWIVPLLNIPPVHVRISGEPERDTKNDSGGQTWFVELNVQLGDKECTFAICLKETRLDLSCWAPDLQIYENLKNHEKDLRDKMQRFGLDLGTFNVFWGEREVESKGSLLQTDA